MAENQTQIPKEHKHGIETEGNLASHDGNDTDGREVRKDVDEDEDRQGLRPNVLADNNKGTLEGIQEELKDKGYSVVRIEDTLHVEGKVLLELKDNDMAHISEKGHPVEQVYPVMMQGNIIAHVEAKRLRN